jgi:dihydroxy-acid dehydratase
MACDIKGNSARILSRRDRAPARSFLKGIGYSDEDLRKSIIGIANTWSETMPCNFNSRQLAARVKQGVRAAGPRSTSCYSMKASA